MILTAEEQTLLARRKSPDLTTREFLQATELQVRIHLHTLPEGGTRNALIAECEGLLAEVNAVDLNAASLTSLNALNQRLVALLQKSQ